MSKNKASTTSDLLQLVSVLKKNPSKIWLARVTSFNAKERSQASAFYWR